MSGANAFIATTKQFASKIFSAPHRSYQPSILSALGFELFAHSQRMGEVRDHSSSR